MWPEMGVIGRRVEGGGAPMSGRGAGREQGEREAAGQREIEGREGGG